MGRANSGVVVGGEFAPFQQDTRSDDRFVASGLPPLARRSTVVARIACGEALAPECVDVGD